MTPSLSSHCAATACESADDEMTPDNRARIRQHLEDCRGCLEAFDFELELRNVIAAKCRDQVPADVLQRLRDFFRFGIQHVQIVAENFDGHIGCRARNGLFDALLKEPAHGEIHTGKSSELRTDVRFGVFGFFSFEVSLKSAFDTRLQPLRTLRTATKKRRALKKKAATDSGLTKSGTTASR